MVKEKMPKYEPGLYKFVVIGFYDVDEVIHKKEIRIFDHSKRHSTQVKKGELAASAGSIAVFDTYWKMYQSYSLTLNVGCDDLVIPWLTEILGFPYKSEHFTFSSNLL
jgi:hypothetical protein